MLCPHCKKTMQLPSYAEINMESYHKACVVNTLCCGKAVYAWPITTFNAEVYGGRKTQDDWGHTIKRPKKDVTTA